MKKSVNNICDHEIIHFLCHDRNSFRGCVKCYKSWPRPHPTLSKEEVVAVIEFGKYVAEQAEAKKKLQEKERKRRERERQEDLDLL
jgi:hypothetical protein